MREPRGGMGGSLAKSGRIGLAMSLGWLVLAAPAGGGPTAAEPARLPVLPAAAAASGEPAGIPPQVSQSIEVFEVEQAVDAAGMVERRLVPPEDLVAGDELRYAILLRNDGQTRIDPGRIQVQTPVPVGARFLPGSAGGAGTLVEYAIDGATFSPHVPDLPVEFQTVAGAASAGADAGGAPVAAAESADPAAVPGPAEPDTPEADAAGAEGTAAQPDAAAPGPAVADAAEPALTIRWTYQQPLAPGAMAEVFFHVRLL